MFPLKPRDELVFGISTQISQNNNENLNILDHVNYFDELCNTSTTISFGTSSSSSTTTLQPRDGTTSRKDIEMRKVVHRNIERQRRQEMSQLYDSLRSFLPLEHIKGRRSLSDIMHVSKDYIKELENNVQKLRDRRDNLKNTSVETSSSNGFGILRNYVKVNKEQNGIEILITHCSEFKMSRVMIELLSSKLDVVNCVSTKINGRFLHKIQAEANDTRLVDLSRLQKRLTCIINLASQPHTPYS